MKWIKFNPMGVNLPKNKRYVLVQLDEVKELGSPPSVCVGYVLRQTPTLDSMNRRVAEFILPGLAIARPSGVKPMIMRTVTHWCDCLGDDFKAPLWKGKQVK